MSTFYVTAVRYSADGSHITHVMAHTSGSTSGRLLKGVVVSKSDVITKISQKNVFTTAIHNYNSGLWHEGAGISIVHNNGKEYLRTDPDKTAKDNLGNLLLIDEIR